jgi:hypothetical protein
MHLDAGAEEPLFGAYLVDTGGDLSPLARQLTSSALRGDSSDSIVISLLSAVLLAVLLSF